MLLLFCWFFFLFWFLFVLVLVPVPFLFLCFCSSVLFVGLSGLSCLAGLLWSLAWLAWLVALACFVFFGPCLVLSCHGRETRIRRIAEYYDDSFVSVPWCRPSDTLLSAVASCDLVQCSLFSSTTASSYVVCDQLIPRVAARRFH